MTGPGSLSGSVQAALDSGGFWAAAGVAGVWLLQVLSGMRWAGRIEAKLDSHVTREEAQFDQMQEQLAHLTSRVDALHDRKP